MSMKKGKGGAMTVDSIIDKLLSVRGKRPGPSSNWRSEKYISCVKSRKNFFGATGIVRA